MANDLIAYTVRRGELSVEVKEPLPPTDWKVSSDPPADGFVRKHYGPGAHPGTGSPQTVHGGGGQWVPSEEDLREVGEARRRMKDRVEAAGKSTDYENYSELLEEFKAMKGIDPKYRKMTLREFRELYGDEEPLSTYYKLTEPWERAIERAVTLGYLSAEDANELGWSESAAWQITELPDQLYHTTTAADAVLESGYLLTREELANETNEPGLGGGPNDTVSYTTDLETAKAIRDVMKEAIQVANGEITFDDLVRMAEEGIGANESFGSAYTHGWNKEFLDEWRQGRVTITLPLHYKTAEEAFANLRTNSSQMGSSFEMFASSDPKDWRPVGLGLNGAYNSWSRPGTQAEQIALTWHTYRTRFLPMRQVRGGILDPYIAHDNWQTVANISPNQVQVISFESLPGAQGLQVGSLSEWRAFSGVGVKIISVVKKTKKGRRLPDIDASYLLRFGYPPPRPLPKS